MNYFRFHNSIIVDSNSDMKVKNWKEKTRRRSKSKNKNFYNSLAQSQNPQASMILQNPNAVSVITQK